MFWPFTKWPTAPAPYDPRASDWNAPARIRALPIDLLRTANYPANYAAVQRGITQVGQQPTFFLPNKARSAVSGPATSGALAMTNAAGFVMQMSNQATSSEARGLVASQAQAKALLQPKLPPVVQRPLRKPSGIYDVPTNPRAVPPAGASEKVMLAKLLPATARMGAGGDAQQKIAQVVTKVRSAAVIPGIARRMMGGR